MILQGAPAANYNAYDLMIDKVYHAYAVKLTYLWSQCNLGSATSISLQ